MAAARRTARIQTRKRAGAATTRGARQAYVAPVGITTANAKRVYADCRDAGGSPEECRRRARAAESRTKSRVSSSTRTRAKKSK